MSRWEHSPHGAHRQLCSANSLHCEGMPATVPSQASQITMVVIHSLSRLTQSHLLASEGQNLAFINFKRRNHLLRVFGFIHSLQMGYTFCQSGQLSLFPPKDPGMVLQNLILPLLSTPGFSHNVWASSTTWQRKQESAEGTRSYLPCGRSRQGRFGGKQRTRQRRAPSVGIFSSAKDVAHYRGGAD